MVKHVASEVGDVKILEAVIIVVAHRDSHSVAHVPNSSLLRDVYELELPGFAQKIAKQAVGGLPTRWRGKLGVTRVLSRIKCSALNQVHIQVTVVVVVEQGHAGAHDFRHVELARRSGEMVELQPHFLGHLPKEWNRRRMSENRARKLAS